MLGGVERLLEQAPPGVLHADLDTLGFAHARYWPADDLAPFVEHYWTVEWNIARACTRETLPHPVVHIVLENDEAQIGGPSTRRWERTFGAGSGRVFAIKFRPGGFRPFVGVPVSTFADRVVALHEFFGDASGTLARNILASPDHATAVAYLEAFLRVQNPRLDDTVALVAGIAERIAVDRSLTRIEQVAAEFALTPRTLQRMFREYVGVGPKWVIQRYRLHEVVERVEADPAVDWAATAAELGYADQAHLVRDFTRLVGRPPATYARAARTVSARARTSRY